jgi:hypothetical protein
MSSKHLIVLACITGCSADPATLVEVSGRALTPIELVAPETAVLDGGSFRWSVVEAPAGSSVEVPRGGAVASVFPDRRGLYLIERWYLFGVGEDLTHRFLVDVAGAPPIAMAESPTSSVAVNASVTIDGSGSLSPEGLPLTYHWRFTTRPMGSVAILPADGQQTTFVPDVAGGYTVELSVSDGELSNDNAATITLNAQ